MKSLFDQDLSGLSFEKVDLWLIVNNTKDASPSIKTENKETLHFLNELANSRVPTVNRRHRILFDIAREPIKQKINLHIIDQTEPGNSDRNIGMVRDEATKAALMSLRADEHDRVLIAHMDADGTFDTDLVRSVVRAFENEPLKFALLNMSYADQYDSEARVYQRKILADFQLAAHSLRMARDGGMPVGGVPTQQFS